MYIMHACSLKLHLSRFAPGFPFPFPFFYLDRLLRFNFMFLLTFSIAFPIAFSWHYFFCWPMHSLLHFLFRFLCISYSFPIHFVSYSFLISFPIHKGTKFNLVPLCFPVVSHNPFYFMFPFALPIVFSYAFTFCGTYCIPYFVSYSLFT